MTLKNNRVPLLSNIKLCASFHRHMWIQTGVTVRKWLNGVMTSVTLTIDLWPLAWASCLSMVITPDNFRMIRWQEYCQKGVTDGQTDRQSDGQTEISVLRAAWSQLKILWLKTGGLLLSTVNRKLLTGGSLSNNYISIFFSISMQKESHGVSLLERWIPFTVSNIRCTLVGNRIVDHSDVVGASPVGAAPTKSSFST